MQIKIGVQERVEITLTPLGAAIWDTLNGEQYLPYQPIGTTMWEVMQRLGPSTREHSIGALFTNTKENLVFNK